MRRKFAVNLIFLFAANLLIKPFWILGIDRVVQNRLGAEVYGTYFAVFNYSFLFSIILDFGINNFNNRAVSRNNKRAGEYMPNLLILKFFLGMVYFGFTFTTALSSGYNDAQLQMLFFLALNQFLLSSILYFRSNLAALQHFKTDSVVSVLDRLLTIIFCSLLMYSAHFKNSFNIMSFIYAQTLALFITGVVAFLIILSKTTLKIQVWEFKSSKMILLKSVPFAFLALLMGIYYRIDAVMLERMLPNGAREAGIYAASFRLLDALNQFGFLFATLLLPLFAGMIRTKEKVSELVKFSAELILTIAITCGVSCYFFRNEIMNLLYHNSNAYWAKIFGWLMLNFIPMSSVYVFGTLLTAKGTVKILNVIAFGGVVLNIGLNLLLIPKQGAFGATIATLITQLITALGHAVAVGEQFRFSGAKVNWSRIAIFSGIVFVIFFFIKILPLPWIWSFWCALLICLVTSMVMKLVPVSRISLLFNPQHA